MSEILLINPSKRGGKKRRARKGKTARRTTFHPRATAAARSYSRRVRRSGRARRRANPIIPGRLGAMLMPAVWGGVGGVATDITYRLLPLPGALSMLKGPMLAPITRIAVAGGVAAVAKHLPGVGANHSREMLQGSLAIIAYELANSLALRFLPTVSAPVSGDSYAFAGNGLGYMGPGRTLQDNSQGVSEYISGSNGEYALDEYIS